MPDENKPVSGEIAATTEVKADAQVSTAGDVDGVENTGVEATTENNDSAEGKKPRKGGFQRKIQREAEARELAERERDYWREQALKTASQAPEKKAEIAPDNPPKLEDFESYDDYVVARAEYAAEKKLLAREAEKEQKQRHESLRAEKTRLSQEYNQRVEKALEKYPDFREVIEDSEAPFNEAMRDAVMESEYGPDIAYYLAQNPKKAEAMLKMGVTALNREIGRLEVMLQKQREVAQSTEEQEELPSRKVTKAPAPISPVKSGSSGSKTYSPNMTQKQYEAWRKNGGGRRA